MNSTLRSHTSIACCGGLRTDFVITLEGQARLWEMGGNAIFSAAGASLWSNSVAIVGRIGSNFPQAWLKDLRARGFDTCGIIDTGVPQDHRTFYAYLDHDTRTDLDPATHFARIGQPMPDILRGYAHSTPGQDDTHAYEPLAVTPDDLSQWVRANATWHEHPVAALHIAPISIRTQSEVPIAARAHGIGIISVDPSERAMRPDLVEHIEAMLATIDVFLPSDQEVRSFFADGRLADANDDAACARWFAARGPRVVVLKQGSRGALVHERGGGFWHVPALKVRVVDVTGAGDSFCGAFMAEFAHSGDPVLAARKGAVAASLVIEDYGVRNLLNASQSDGEARLSKLSAS
jgi:ribokinase